MEKLTYKNRPNQNIDCCLGMIIGIKLMLENGYNKKDLAGFMTYLWPDRAQERDMDEFINIVEAKPYYNPNDPNQTKPSLNTHYKEYYDILVKEYNEVYGQDSDYH